MNFYTLLEVSLVITTLVDNINFLAWIIYSARNTFVKSADCEDASTESTYTSSFCTRTTSIGGAKGINEDILLIWSSLSNGKSTKNTNRDTYIEVVDIGDINIKNIYANKSTAIKNVFFARGACVKGVFIGNACIKSTYIGSIGIVEYSIIYLQSFWILKIGSTRLKIWVGTGW